MAVHAAIEADPPPLKWPDSKYDFDVEEDIRWARGIRLTYYRWRKEFGGLQTNQVKRIKDLEQENARLRKAVSDLTIDKQILAEATKGNF